MKAAMQRGILLIMILCIFLTACRTVEVREEKEEELPHLKEFLEKKAAKVIEGEKRNHAEEIDIVASDKEEKNFILKVLLLQSWQRNSVLLI